MRGERTSVHWPAVLRIRPAAGLLAATLVGRLPLGIVPVALLLAADGRSYAAGAALVAAYGLAVAVGQPLLGRVVDRHGPTLPLTSSAFTSAAALGVVAVAGTASLTFAAGAVIVAGLSTAPLEGTLRSRLAHLVPATHLRAAREFETGSGELVYVVGPLAATAAAVSFGPGAALALAGVLGIAGSLAVALAPCAGDGAPARRRIAPELLGALHSAGLRLVLLAAVAIGAAYGAFVVASVAAADRHGAPWLTGMLPATVSLSAIAGTALLTAFSARGRLRTHLLISGATFAIGWLPLSVLDPPPGAALACAVLPGLAFGPLLACSYAAVDTLARDGTLVEAVGWLVAALGVGDALGTAAAGALDGSWHVPATSALAALPLLCLLRSHLTVPSDTTSAHGEAS
ncbi:transporter (plasmid) [Streptomyces sp. NBC_00445]|uniref:MFS transporter n=1 Tax=Streptomyces sp. NBC_00445 TaxID=2975745 RepID=UPI002E23FF5F